MIPMTMFKKNGGFTLVELIVVIAILAILAGVAVPAYSGYIAKAEQASALQTLSAVNTAAQGLAIGDNLKVTKIVVTNEGNITVTTTDAAGANESTTAITEDEVEQLTGTLTFKAGTFATATWTATSAEWTLNRNVG
jgi:type IV pilus assembly protein PilA